MFGKNPLLGRDKGDGSTLRVVKGSPWSTIQGEGPYAGHPATFIRLHGCNLRCTFCDTEFSSPDDPTLSVDDLVRVCQDNTMANLVVITGGEPLRQDIRPLCRWLHGLGFKVQIETAGTLWLDGLEEVAEIVVSPKTPVIHQKIRAHATAFKYVISNRDDHENFIPIAATQPGTEPRLLAPPREGAPVYLSPMDEYDEARNAANRRLVGQLAMEYGVIAGLQLHKFLELD